MVSQNYRSGGNVNHWKRDSFGTAALKIWKAMIQPNKHKFVISETFLYFLSFFWSFWESV